MQYPSMSKMSLFSAKSATDKQHGLLHQALEATLKPPGGPLCVDQVGVVC